jgi:hypothetical protein
MIAIIPETGSVRLIYVFIHIVTMVYLSPWQITNLLPRLSPANLIKLI